MTKAVKKCDTQMNRCEHSEWDLQGVMFDVIHTLNDGRAHKLIYFIYSDTFLSTMFEIIV